MTTRTGILHVDSWAGRLMYEVRVIGETPRRYRIESDTRIALPGRYLAAGESVLVPKYAVSFAK